MSDQLTARDVVAGALDATMLGAPPQGTAYDQADRVIAALRSARLLVDPTAGWQLIDTAPKDGTSVLLYEPMDAVSGYVWTDCWDTTANMWTRGDILQPDYWRPILSLPQVSA